ncbi:PREDICTED: G-box-binding factor 4-like isoform X1 [Nicotiana attenuata]|uniref:G-box-binding factor 4 n=1 Tax=Nicotiana attenuata TaxID=49451 RepID=A0A314L0U5_NICAT|nr:PREDICTED: G-box-binding factor 4-like isoform X1 [Nicotiana attenuata]OIT35095.1 g-box-binding factor 4 [Nicotiana attenuata]
MASMKLMTSSASRNSDRRKSSASSSSSSSTMPHDLQFSNNGSNNSSSNLEATSVTPDVIFRNVYGESHNNALLNTEITLLDAAGAITPISDSETLTAMAVTASEVPPVRRTVDDVWREIVEGKREKQRAAVVAGCKEEMMTLEDFLVKAGAVEEEAVAPVQGPEVKVELGTERLSGGIFAFDNSTPYMVTPQQSVPGYGRGKRKAVLEPLDKAAMQRQRRMIKNRESAARSRERKQAYQVELESIAVKLEEENELLLKEKEERTRAHYKQLIEKVIPVVDKRKPPRVLRRVCSMQW